MTEDRHYAVVLLTGSECEEHPGMPCVMETLGPYTWEEAEAVFRQQPEWACPHLMILRRDHAENLAAMKAPP